MAAKAAGPGRWGLWYLMSTIIAYTPLLELGIPSGMQRVVPIMRGRGAVKELDLITRTSSGLVLLTATLMALAILVAAVTVSGAELQKALFYLAALVFCTKLYDFSATYLRATRRFSLLSTVMLVQSVVLLAVGLPLLHSRGLWGFVEASVIAMAGSVAIVLTRVYRELTPHISLSHVPELIAAGIPLMMIGVSQTAMMTLDRWVVTGMLGTKAVGLYSLAGTVAIGLYFIPAIVSMYAYPQMAHNWGRDRCVETLRRLVRRQTLLGIACTMPVVSVLLAFSPFAVRSFLPSYAPGIRAIQIVSVSFLIQPVAFAYANVLVTLNRQWTYLAIQIASSAGSLALCATLIKLQFGITGAAISSCSMSILYSLAMVIAGYAAVKAETSHHSEL
jgi:O-antigen/teichoic acid export membrane protein